VLALPLALLHNQPFLAPSQSPKFGIHDAVVIIIIIVEAIIATLFASIGAKLSHSPSPEGSRRFLSAWFASLLCGCALGFGGSQLLLLLDGHGFYSLWNILLTLCVAFSFASLGLFHFYGIPTIAIRMIKHGVSAGRLALILWIIGAAMVGGLLLAGFFFTVIDRTGIGAEGSGLFVMLAWPYFSWGAGIGASYLYSRPSRIGWNAGG
jgi:hypothetical protein